MAWAPPQRYPAQRDHLRCGHGPCPYLGLEIGVYQQCLWRSRPPWTIRSPAGVDRSDLCLTAELTARPDNIGVVGRGNYTSAEICLREDPVVLLQEGEAYLLNLFPCVGVATYPCSSTDTLELVVNGRDAAREAGIGRDDATLDPGKVIVQVKDPDGRAKSPATPCGAREVTKTATPTTPVLFREWLHLSVWLPLISIHTAGPYQIPHREGNPGP